jgi:hypothetical protein
MATIKINQFRARQFGGASPFGNFTTLPFKLETASNGSANNANSTAAIASGDKVVLGVLPPGMNLQDYMATVSTAFTASVTANIGFEYVDGVDDADVPQNASYFGAAVAINTAGVYRKVTTTAPVTLPKEAYLILTTGGANNAKAARVDIAVMGELTGAK